MNKRDQAVKDILYSALEEANTMEDTKVSRMALFAALAAFRAYDAGYDNACRTLRRRRRKKQGRR